MADPVPSAPVPTQTPPAESPQPQAAVAQPPTVTIEDDEKFFAALGYFGFLFIVPLIVKPKSTYCRFHARQSMVLFLTTIVILIVLASSQMFGSILTLALFALYVLAIYRAYKGDLWNIPLISQLAGKVNVDALYNKAGLAVSGISGLKEKAAGMASQATEGMKNLAKQEAPPQAAAPAPASPPPPPPASSPPPAAPTPPKA